MLKPETESVFNGVGLIAGIIKWRIHNFKLERCETNLVEFYTGDSYIVLHTEKIGPNVFRYNVHYWIGDTTTADEAGTAAYETVELCEVFGRKPIQHREVAHYESDHFLAYFEGFGGIRILTGGYDSGFHHTNIDQPKPRLLQIKGRRVAKTTQVPLECKSLRTGDVFILDLGKIVYQWNGIGASIRECFRAAQVVRALDNDRKGVEIRVMEQSEYSTCEETDFWSHFSGTFGDVQLEPTIDEEINIAQPVCVWKRNGEMFIEASDVKSHNDLLSSEIYVCDTKVELYVWVGSQTLHHIDATKYAKDFLKSRETDHICIIYEGSENDLFRALF